MNIECKTGYKDYQIKLFQKNKDQDLGSQIRANHKGDTDYTLMSIKPYDGEREDGQREVADYVLKQVEGAKKFTTKHDALIFGQSLQNMVYALMRYGISGSKLDRIEAKLTGDDKAGYGIDFVPKYSKEL